jgi:hypothetical protein
MPRYEDHDNVLAAAALPAANANVFTNWINNRNPTKPINVLIQFELGTESILDIVFAPALDGGGTLRIMALEEAKSYTAGEGQGIFEFILPGDYSLNLRCRTTQAATLWVVAQASGIIF